MIDKIYRDTYRINEWGSFGNVKTYLLVGKEKALLIDTGYGKTDLAKKVKLITEKPVMVVLTHGHIDHVGGSFRFKDVHLKREDLKIWMHHTDPSFMNEYFKTAPHHYQNPSDVPLTTIDLGQRSVEIIATPGHTKGSISIIDKQGKTAFVGDFINPLDTWLGLEESLSVEEYHESLKYLQEIMKVEGITKIYSGHNFVKMSPKIVEDYIILCEKIIHREIKTPKYKDKGICKGYVARYKKAKLIYKR